MLKIDDKVFLNIQEAVGWLLANNCIPFQCTAPYAANTEIGLGTIVNPSPAKLRIGSIIFFSDSKVSTVTGITENGFIVSDEYNSLVDDLVYVSNVAVDASGHLIVTLSDGNEIDAGQIKMISSFSITASQHLLAVYNDGTTQDLGAIFAGNVNIAGTLTANTIIENMVGYEMFSVTSPGITKTDVYGGIVKTGNKLTIAYAAMINVTSAPPGTGWTSLVNINIPASVGQKLYVAFGSYTLSRTRILACDTNDSVGGDKEIAAWCLKGNDTRLTLALVNDTLSALTLNKDYYVRLEFTFLLSDSMI